VMLTSTDVSAAPADLPQAHIRSFVSKPVRRADLFRAVRNVTTAAGEEPPASGAMAPVPAAAAVRGTVLLVEDNTVNQQVAAAMLSKLGLKVVLASNGREAVERVREQRFDLVLMDCQMPEMDGYDATAAIRRLPARRRARLPVVALTANAMQDDEQKCLDAGMDDFLAKPFTLQQLYARLVRWLPPTDEADSGHAAAVVINPQVLDSLHGLDPSGSDGLVRKVLEIFLESAARGIDQIEDAIRGGDGHSLSRAAHTLKSGAANVGAEALSNFCRQLERLGREQRLDEARALLNEVRREHERARSRIREILQEAA